VTVPVVDVLGVGLRGTGAGDRRDPLDPRVPRSSGRAVRGHARGHQAAARLARSHRQRRRPAVRARDARRDRRHVPDRLRARRAVPHARDDPHRSRSCSSSVASSSRSASHAAAASVRSDASVPTAPPRCSASPRSSSRCSRSARRSRPTGRARRSPPTTAWRCARTAERDRPVLWLDTLPHSHVDPTDPTVLAFTYTAWYGDVDRRARARRAGAACAAHRCGGLTMPRYLRSEHPGSDAARARARPAGHRRRAAPARFVPGGTSASSPATPAGPSRRSRRSARSADAAFDLVIGDAFGGIAVPWHLTTREFTADLHALMAPDGVYLLNIIDHGTARLPACGARDDRDVFAHVAVLERGRRARREPRGHRLGRAAAARRGARTQPRARARRRAAHGEALDVP
jgi:hypothetical protein